VITSSNQKLELRSTTPNTERQEILKKKKRSQDNSSKSQQLHSNKHNSEVDEIKDKEFKTMIIRMINENKRIHGHITI
jgi:hypothetical protein